MYATQITVLFLFVKIAFADDCNVPVVTTTAGEVRGFVAESRFGRPYLAYTGIPFAKAPTGNLRFRPPEEPEKWTGVRDATKNGPFCIQYNLYQEFPEVVGSEDCLHLSVFTFDIKGKAPVLVHIHGGGFIAGDKSKTNPKYFMDEDVVVVDINYRLGIMGFLSFEDNELPGNQGMKDQVMALRWVQKNIARFGGNPTKVTLVGENSGGASVIHHIISPLSKGLFHRAIAQSGSSYNIWAVMPPGLAKEKANKLARLALCSFKNTTKLVKCLQNKNANDLVELMKHFMEEHTEVLTLRFQPVLEAKGSEAFLTGPISSWKHNPVPLLIGITAGEGFLKSKDFVNNMDFKYYNDNFEKLAPVSFLYDESASNPDEVTRKIKQYYFKDKEITQAEWFNINDAYSDSWFTIGVLDAANKHTGDVYFYYFDYIGKYTYAPKKVTLEIVVGPEHGEEMLYIWYNDDAPDLKGNDLLMSQNLVKIWTNFAKKGTASYTKYALRWPRWKHKVRFPCIPGSIRTKASKLRCKWSPQRHRYVHIYDKGFLIREGLLEDRYNFWSSLNYKDKFGMINQ